MGDPSSPPGVESSRANVVVGDEQHEIDIDAQRWARLARAVLDDCRQPGELTLTFVERDEIAALNVEYMGGVGPTDVLSFPLDAAEPHDLADLEHPPPILLGDVVVCPAVAAEAAPGHAGSLDDELALLTVHGVLHVVGYDHADPAGTAEMRGRELELLQAHHWHGPAPAGFRQEQS